MTRKRYQWKLRNRDLQLGERTLIMAVINVTPDSFSDGGRYSDPDRAFAHAIELEEAGADIVDIGAESTRPGSMRISEETELHRLVPVLKRLRDRMAIPISVDTYKSGVAKAALDYGVEIINDPSGHTLDPNLVKTAAQYDAGVVINHMRGTPDTWAKLPPMKDAMAVIVADLGAAVHRARQVGVDRSRIVVDPGLGFGKRKEQNLEILARLPELAALDLPILVGPSRKSFLKQPGGQEAEIATAAAVTAAVLAGAHIVRVHAAREISIAAQLADAVLSSARQED
jgi:dihydropteroate synthase